MAKARQNNLSQPIRTALLIGSSFPILMASAAVAQDAPDEIIATGIRQSLENALIQKREAESLVEIILAEDIGKLPDQNLAEVLENITGVQITRTAGVGTNVQIRGTDDNRTEINGVSTLGSGSGRTGIDFEDVNASIIAGVEVTKVPEAKTIEGSVGGTINLKTIRPLDLNKPLIAARIQGEDSNLSIEGIQPRFSAALGNSWETGAGEFGIVLSGSYTEQEAVSFRPRADRDTLRNVNGQDFLGIQFLLQEQENDDFETINLAGTAEWAPNEETKFYFDAFINDQERSRDQYRLQASGVSALANVTVPTSTETVDFGQGVDFGNGPGVIEASLTGTLEPDLSVDDDDPNLRFTSETNARVTESQVFALGGEWERDNWKISAQGSVSRSDTETPNLSTTLNFINPNCPLDGAPTGDPSTSNDNCVPFIFDLSDETLSFGINFDSPFAPTPEQLRDPANVVLDAVAVSENTTENEEDAVRFDVSYDFSDNDTLDFLTSIDAGYRYNTSSSEFEDIDDNIGGFSRLEDSPRGTLFSEILIEGPDNFGDGDGRDLFISNFLLVDPDLAFSDREGTLAILEGALAAQRLLEPQADGELTSEPTSDQNAFFSVSEDTHAIYAQANFETGIFRGNIGGRFIATTVDSTAFGPEDAEGNRSLVTESGSYEVFLPRVNVIANVLDDVAFRFGYSEDILRPSFSNLNTGFTFDQSENASVSLGNSGLSPESVDSIDISAEWYFAPSSVFSVGFFQKDRTNLFTTESNFAALIEGPNENGFEGTGGFTRETDPNCPGGGTFNPEVIPNQLGDPDVPGLCVDFSIPANDPSVTTQWGIEVGFQGDLSSFEDRLGWASGFGLLANYTYQQFSGGSALDTASGRGSAILGDISIPEGLLDFSENAYNITGYYEKYGLSARLRYTWRDEFRTNDFGGGANVSGSSTFGFPVVTESRGQFNGSINYDITENFSVGVEGVNLTKAGIIPVSYTHLTLPTIYSV